MNVPDFLVWRCANCGAPADGTKKLCACGTNVGVREGPSGAREQTWFDAEPDPRDATIATLRALLDRAEKALTGVIKEAGRDTPAFRLARSTLGDIRKGKI